MIRFAKFEVLTWLELSRKQIRTFKRVYILAVIDNRISHMDKFEIKLFFAGGKGLFSSK